MNRLPHSAGAIGAILSLFDNKKDFVHDSSLACPFWQPMQALVLSSAITSLGACMAWSPRPSSMGTTEPMQFTPISSVDPVRRKTAQSCWHSFSVHESVR
jgi:hypothetical protein